MTMGDAKFGTDTGFKTPLATSDPESGFDADSDWHQFDLAAMRIAENEALAQASMREHAPL